MGDASDSFLMSSSVNEDTANDLESNESVDHLLDVFFDDMFVHLRRDGLMARYRRKQLADYFSTVIAGCCQGSGCAPGRGAARAAAAALRYHGANKSANGGVCLMGKFHNILYVAAKVCVDWKVQDNKIVAALLEEIFACEKTFERLFIGSIFGPNITNLLSGWKSDYRNNSENMFALEYFLKHASKAKMEFNCGTKHAPQMKRLIDVPLESYRKVPALNIAVQIAKQDVVLLLLRYGAKLTCVQEYESAHIKTPVIHPRVPGEGASKCVRYIERTIPMIVPIPGPQIEDVTYGEHSIWNDIIYIRHDFDGIDAFPEIIDPPRLKHLCRCVIRKQLWLCWQLPKGINYLKIPASLQNYLNLDYD